MERGRFFLSPQVMFNHHGGGPKLLQSHAVNATQHIWYWVTTGPSKLCMAFFNNGDSSLCRCGTAFYGVLELQMAPATCRPLILWNAWSQGPSLRGEPHAFFLEYMIHERTIATWRWDAATLQQCFVKWPRSPASLEIPNCILKSHKQLCSIRSCSCIRYRGPLSRASCTCHCMGMNKCMHVDCLHIHDLQKKLHRPSSLRFPPKRSLLVTVLCLQVCYSRSRFARSTCSVVKQKARTFAVEVCSARSFSFHWLKQHELVRRSFGGEQVTGPNMSNTSWLSRTEAGPKMAAMS